MLSPSYQMLSPTYTMLPPTSGPAPTPTSGPTPAPTPTEYQALLTGIQALHERIENYNDLTILEYGSLSEKIDELETNVAQRIEDSEINITQRIDDLEQHVDTQHSNIEDEFDSINQVLNEIKTYIVDAENTNNQLQQDLGAFTQTITDLSSYVRDVNGGLRAEIKQIVEDNSSIADTDEIASNVADRIQTSLAEFKQKYEVTSSLFEKVKNAVINMVNLYRKQTKLTNNNYNILTEEFEQLKQKIDGADSQTTTQTPVIQQGTQPVQQTAQQYPNMVPAQDNSALTAAIVGLTDMVSEVQSDYQTMYQQLTSLTQKVEDLQQSTVATTPTQITLETIFGAVNENYGKLEEMGGLSGQVGMLTQKVEELQQSNSITQNELNVSLQNYHDTNIKPVFDFLKTYSQYMQQKINKIEQYVSLPSVPPDMDLDIVDLQNKIAELKTMMGSQNQTDLTIITDSLAALAETIERNGGNN